MQLKKSLTLFRMGGSSPTSFSPVTSTNVGISSKNFLTFSFNIFATMVWNFKAIPSASPKLLAWIKTFPQNKWFFWSSLYKTEVMIISLIEMLELPNFSHITTFTKKFEWRDKILLVMDGDYDVITFISKYFSFKKV